MRLTYDPRSHIAYLRLHEKTAQVETIRVSDEFNIDIAPDGTVYGIELLNANVQLGAEDQGKLVIINEALGNRQEISLTREPLSTMQRSAFYALTPTFAANEE